MVVIIPSHQYYGRAALQSLYNSSTFRAVVVCLHRDDGMMTSQKTENPIHIHSLFDSNKKK
jgi:hypothetical protein